MMPFIDIFTMILMVAFIFLICRELVCWYFKFNRIVSVLEKINKKLDVKELKGSEKNQ